MADITHLLGEIAEIDEALKTHKLSQSDYDEIVKILNRAPNLIELGIFFGYVE